MSDLVEKILTDTVDFVDSLKQENAKLRDEIELLNENETSYKRNTDALRQNIESLRGSVTAWQEVSKKAEAERDDMVSEAYYQGLKAGIFVTPPDRPNGENVTACAISHFEHSLDRHCRGLSIQYVEQLRKETDQ